MYSTLVFFNYTSDMSKRYSILVIEDDYSNLRVLEIFLSQFSFKVLSLDSSEKAWEFLSQTTCTFDIILSDIRLPKLNGLDLARKIKASSHLKFIPLFAITAYANEDYRNKCFDSGFDYFFPSLSTLIFSTTL
tara:strand:+ start:13471 stop:13869 length:399 start_codon:yes stop_codon:yes gene_type:complete